MKARTLSLAIFFMALSHSASSYAGEGSNGGGGTDPVKVAEGAIEGLINGDSLKNAMMNYLRTVRLEQIEDAQVKATLTRAMAGNALLEDIPNSRYVRDDGNCKDAYGRVASASTRIGVPGAQICFDVGRLAENMRGLGDEALMIRLAAVAFHEHTHHFQVDDRTRERVAANEAEGDRVAGYVVLTARFVTLPLLRWTPPGSGPDQFRQIQAMYAEIRAREQAFIAPSPEDYSNYPDFQNKTDRGVVRLLPREVYDGKVSIRGGGSYYSFARRTHEYGKGSDLQLERGSLSVGFAGCDFGYIQSLGNVPLDSVRLGLSSINYLETFMPARSEPSIRVQQRAALDGTQVIGSQTFSASVDRARVENTYVVRSISFGDSDVLVAFRIIRRDTDGSLILAWKKLKTFPVSECR